MDPYFCNIWQIAAILQMKLYPFILLTLMVNHLLILVNIQPIISEDRLQVIYFGFKCHKKIFFGTVVLQQYNMATTLILKELIMVFNINLH